VDVGSLPFIPPFIVFAVVVKCPHRGRIHSLSSSASMSLTLNSRSFLCAWASPTANESKSLKTSEVACTSQQKTRVSIQCHSHSRNHPIGSVGHVPSNFGESGDPVYIRPPPTFVMAMMFLLHSDHYPLFCFYITPAVFERFTDLVIGRDRSSRDDSDDQSATTSSRSGCDCTTGSRVSGGQLNTDEEAGDWTSDEDQSEDDDDDDDDESGSSSESSSRS